MRPIVLASGSQRRREIMSQIGLDFTVVPSKVQERRDCADPADLVKELSAQKALDVAGRVDTGTIVIGADTVVYADGEVLGKPCNADDAFRMISMIQGGTHQVYTGVTVIDKGETDDETITFSEMTSVSVYPMTQQEILRYVNTEEPYDKAGGYAVQGTFAAYIRSIDGCYYNVMGLPAGRLYQELKGRI